MSKSSIGYNTVAPQNSVDYSAAPQNSVEVVFQGCI
jgi:hypothetical protein